MALLNSSTIFRNKQLKRNSYSNNAPYGPSHKNALSDGDEKGKGEKNGSIGSKTDIYMRSKLLATNKFSPNKPYDSVNELPL